MKKVLAIIIISVLLLSGCDEAINEGKVIDKSYEDKYVFMMPMYINGTTMFIPIEQPEEYHITIEKYNEKRNIEVRKEEYEMFDIGDYYSEERR